MTSNIFAIAKNTFRETIRDRVLLSVVFVILAIILFSLFIGSISLDQNIRIITNFGVTAIYALQIFVAIFIGSMLMYKEIERKTFYLILPKPISRSQIIIGKCLGLTATTVLVSAISTLFLFVLLAIKGGTSSYLPILLSVFLTSVEAVLLILISLLFSSIFSPVMAALSTLGMYIIGHGGSIFRYIFTTTDSPTAEIVLRAIYHVLPNLEKFNIRNEIIYGTIPGASMLAFSLLYALVYGGFLLFITRILFDKKDF